MGGVIKRYDAASNTWKVVGPQIPDLLPVGLISMWSGALDTLPDNWALCDGANGTPDLRDRFVVGAGDTYAVGDTGGAGAVALTAAELPSHAHASGNLAGASHTHGVGTLNVDSHAHGSGDLTGGNHAHNSGTLAGGNHTHASGSYNADSHTHGSGNINNNGGGAHNHAWPGQIGNSAMNHGLTDGFSGRASTSGGVFTFSTANNQGAHNHGISGNTDGSGNVNVSGNSSASTVSISGTVQASGVNINGNTAGSGANLSGASAGSSVSVSGDTGATGSGSAHENRPPFYALAFIMYLGT